MQFIEPAGAEVPTRVDVGCCVSHAAGIILTILSVHVRLSQGCHIEGALHMTPAQLQALQGGRNSILPPPDAAATSLPLEEGPFVFMPDPFTRKM